MARQAQGWQVGTGRWFDAVITNLIPPALPEIPGDRAPIRKMGG